MHLTTLACGLGGRHVVDGLLGRLRDGSPHDASAPSRLTIVGGTAEDITLCGLRFCSDLDALTDTLVPSRDAGGQHVREHLVRLGAMPEWYPADDTRIADAIARSRWLGGGMTPSEICAHILATRGAEEAVRLLPMSDDPIETHVVVEEDETPQAMHVLEWVCRSGASPAPTRVSAAGLAHARPAPGVLDAIRGADAIALPLTQPVTGLGILLGLPGVRDALRGTSATVVGVSPALLPARGDEPATLTTLDLDHTSTDVGGLVADLLDVYVVPAGEVEALTATPPFTDVRIAGVELRAAGGVVDAQHLAEEICDALLKGGSAR